MKIKTTFKAFTLIELLVVITIIGILATGAVSIYTSQIQKARDSTRLTSIKALQGGVEQFYQDDGAYPAKGTAFSGVTIYVPRLPKDPKNGQASSNSVFDYLYSVSADSNTVDKQEFEISTHFEQQGNIDTKAKGDGGDDDYRMEIGINVDDDTNKPTEVSGGGDISGVSTYECVTPAGASGNCGTDDNPMLIRGN